MPSISAPVQPIGPIVRLAVLVSDPRREALVAANRPVPNPILINGLLDTGASSTCIDPAVMQSLGLTPTGFVPIITPSTGTTPHMCEQYDVAIAVLLRGSAVHIIDTLPVIASPLAHQGHEALIGRDVLSRAILIYNGHEGNLTLCF